MHHLITASKRITNADTQQMKNLYTILETDWDRFYSQYTNTYICEKDGKKLKEIETSFGIHLKTSAWIPAINTSVELQDTGVISWVEKVEYMQPSCLYIRFPQIVRLLDYTVMYVDMEVNENSDFCKFLGFNSGVSQEDIKKFLIGWGERKKDNEPGILCAKLLHIKAVYEYMQQNMPQKDIQDLLHNYPVIFVPLEDRAGVDVKVTHENYPADRSQVLAGRMLNRKEVWWSDPSGLFKQHRSILYNSDIGKKWLLDEIYGDSELTRDFLVRGGRIEMEPRVTEYRELLVLMSQVVSLEENTILTDVLRLYELIGRKVTMEDDEQTSLKVNDQDTRAMMIENEKKQLLR